MEQEGVTVLVAEDDADDRLLIGEAAEEGGLCAALRFVGDGAELLAYLRHAPPYADPLAAPRPDLILLDLNLPRLDGREALRELKADPGLRRIPVVVMTTSRAQEDVVQCYHLGAASYIVKPSSFHGLVEVMRALASYWTETVRLP